MFFFAGKGMRPSKNVRKGDVAEGLLDGEARFPARHVDRRIFEHGDDEDL